MKILQVGQFFTNVTHRGTVITMVVLMISYNVDNVFELCSTVFKEHVIIVALGMLTQEIVYITIRQITCHTDISAENQYISVICVVKF